MPTKIYKLYINGDRNDFAGTNPCRYAAFEVFIQGNTEVTHIKNTCYSYVRELKERTFNE